MLGVVTNDIKQHFSLAVEDLISFHLSIQKWQFRKN